MIYLPIFCLSLAVLGGIFLLLAHPQTEIGAALQEFGKVCLGAALLLIFVFAAIGCAPSKLGRALNVGVGVSAAGDFITTRDAIDSGRGKEGNPAMDFGPWGQGVLKAAGVSAVIGAASLMDAKGQKQWAHVMRIVFIAFNTAVAIHNHGVGR